MIDKITADTFRPFIGSAFTSEPVGKEAKEFWIYFAATGQLNWDILKNGQQIHGIKDLQPGDVLLKQGVRYCHKVCIYREDRLFSYRSHLTGRW